MFRLSCFATFVLSLLLGFSARGATGELVDENARFNGFHGVIVDSIIIDNRNIYDTSDPEFDNFLFKSINRFHVKTARVVIEREILLEIGQPFDSTLASETERNLRRWLLVYDAWVKPSFLPNGHLKVVVTTIDQWTLNAGLDYAREGNDKRIRIGLTEKNLAGYNLRLSGYYVDDSREGEYFEGSFSDSRLFGHPLQVLLAYNDNPKSKVRSLLVKKPFYNLAQNWAAAGLVSVNKGRQDYYQSDSLVGLTYYNQDFFDSEIRYRFGDSYNKKSIALLYQYKYETNQSYGLPDFHQNTAVDTLYHRLGLELLYEKYRYYKGVNFDGIDYTEDIILGRFLSLAYKRAYRSDFKSVYYYKIDLLMSYYTKLSDLMLFSRFEQNYWFDGSHQLRKFSQLLLSGYIKPDRSLLFAGQLKFTQDKIDSGLENLFLGGETGIRGYDTYYRSGDNRLVANFETRLVSPLKILTARFGAVAFVDAGRIWKGEDNFEWDDFSFSYGLGLRIGFENSTQNIVRIDLVRTDRGDYEISAGTGQYFNLPGAY